MSALEDARLEATPRPKVKSGRPRRSTREQTGRAIARYWYSLDCPCEDCNEAPAVDRHHIDGDPLNNSPENVARLCRKCHMLADGRIGAPRPQRTHCKHGHEFTPGNTYVTPSTGRRACRICRARISREHEATRVRRTR